MTTTGDAELFEAARAGEASRVLALVDDGPERLRARDPAGASLLHVAAERDDVELARGLLERGADPEAESGWGQTAFEWAANMGSASVAELLLARGAGRHTLWTAAALGRVDEVAALLEGRPEGADRHAAPAGRASSAGTDLTGWPEETAFRRGDSLSDAFYIACRNGHLRIARTLADAGADLGAKGYFGASALHWAALGGHVEVVRWLLSAGAPPGDPDPRFDATPAGWAREGGHADLAERLERAARDGSA